MADTSKEYPQSIPVRTAADHSDKGTSVVSENCGGNHHSNPMNDSSPRIIDPDLVIPTLYEINAANSPTSNESNIPRPYEAQMDYRIAQAWISSAPDSPSKKKKVEEFQDEMMESIGEDQSRKQNNNSSSQSTIRNSFEGLCKSLFSYSYAGVQQQLQDEEDPKLPRGQSWRGGDHQLDSWPATLRNGDDLHYCESGLDEYDNTSMPTPPSIPDDLMDLSFNNNISNNGEGTNNEDDQNDDPNLEANGSSSLKAVASPQIFQESSFLWMKNPETSLIPKEIDISDDQRASVEDEQLTGDGERLIRPPTLGAAVVNRPTPIQQSDRQETPQSWHTPISMLPRALIKRNTSGGSRRTRGSAPLSPGSRWSGKSEKYFHSYETNPSASPRPVPPFVVVHSKGSANVKVTPKRTMMVQHKTTNKSQTNSSAIDVFIPEENGEANCGCDGSVTTSTKTWCKTWGRPVTIAITSAVFVLAVVTVITSLVASRTQEEQEIQLRPPISETIESFRPSRRPTKNPEYFPPTNNDLVLDADHDDLGVLWEGVEKRPYEDTTNPMVERPTFPPRTYPPSVSPKRGEIFIPTSAPTMLPTNFPDFVPTDDLGVDGGAPLQVPWNDYVIGLLAIESPNTFDAFDDPTSPQFLALRWISRDTFQKGGSEAYTMGASIQRFALATIYFALKGPSTWLDNNLWLSTVVSVCEWKGVTCDSSNTSVSSLELPDNGLSGTLPDELKLLKYLHSINFSGNNIVGSLPPNYSLLSDLEELNLSNNHLTGRIPEEFGGSGNFGILKTVNLCSNSMTGTIPPSLGSLNELTTLMLGNNQYSGDLPGSICSFVFTVVDCNIGCDCCIRCCGSWDRSNGCC